MIMEKRRVKLSATTSLPVMGAVAMCFEADTERVCQAGYSLGYLFSQGRMGRKWDWAEEEVKAHCRSEKALHNPMGKSGSYMTFQSCPTFGQSGWAFLPR